MTTNTTASIDLAQLDKLPLADQLAALAQDAESKRQAEENPNLERIHLGMRDAFHIAEQRARSSLTSGAPAEMPSERDMLDMATVAGLYPNTIHYWMPALQRYTAAVLAAPVHDAATPSAQQARYRMPEGVKNQIETLEWKVRNLERALEMRKLHETGDVWYWQGDGADNLNSMSMGMIVVIRAEQLRDLVSGSAAAKTEQDAGHFAWAALAENGNVIIWSRQRSQVEPVAAKYGRPVVPVISLDTAAGAGSAQPAAPECGMCNGSGIVGFPPDQYEDCPDCVKARAAIANQGHQE